MKTSPWAPSEADLAHYRSEGYMILKNLVSRDEAMMIRGVILNHVLTPEPGENCDSEVDPMDPMNRGSAEGRAARFRKLGGFGKTSPVLWHNFFTSDALLAVASYFYGPNLTLKFDSCFLKPAQTGSATPWHQDNGLWRDGEVNCFNVWMAIDPATRENGCMQFIPGSHREPIHPHVLYPDSIHGEIPRELVEQAKATYGLHHIELNPGDAVCWHSNLFHSSPPNQSAKSRIAIAGVFCEADAASMNPYHRRHFWCTENGEIVPDFPPRQFEGYQVAPGSIMPFIKVA